MNTSKSSLMKFLSITYGVFGLKLWMVLALNIFGTLSETLGIVLLLPLLTSVGPTSIIEPEKLGVLSSVTESLIQYMQLLAPTSDVFLLLVLLIGFFFIVKGCFTFAAYAVINLLNGRMMYKMRSNTLDAISKSDWAFFKSQPTGHYTNVLGEQVQRSFLAFKYVSEFAGKAISAAIYVAIALYINWGFGLIAIVAGLAIVIAFRSLNAKVRAMSILSSQYSTEMQSMLIEYIKSFKYLKATGNENLLVPRVKESFQALSAVKIKTGIYDSFTLSVREPILVLMVLSLIYVEVSYFDVPISSVLVSILLFHRGLNSTVVAQRQWQAALEYFGGLETVNDLLKSAENSVEKSGNVLVDPEEVNVAIRNASFRYIDRNDFSLNISEVEFTKKSAVAIIGPSGSGKSTLLDLVTLLEQADEGRVDVNGKNIKHLNRSDWRNKIGYVVQETSIYSNSIEWNITLGRDSDLDPETRKRKLYEAARLANVDEFIMALPNKYETLLTESGGNMSGGQRQRLVLARELYKNPALLILDEATSALDSESEAAISESLNSLKSKMTIIIVAHRLSTIQLVDYIYVVDKGAVVQAGTYEELVNDKKSYLSQAILRELN